MWSSSQFSSEASCVTDPLRHANPVNLCIILWKDTVEKLTVGVGELPIYRLPVTMVHRYPDMGREFLDGG